MPDSQVIVGDCIEVMRGMAAGSVVEDVEGQMELFEEN